MNANIVSIGYEGLTVDALVSKLRLHSVTTLVDVRLNAISRKRGFSKRALTEALADAGIGYLHFPELGNHRDNRAGYSVPATSEGDVARSAFRSALATEAAREAILNLRDHAKTGPIAVFCYEADEKHCHREQVIDAVLDRSLVVA
jgi:uncharacterized protein (DUF488 family)